jgi:hypothetical protein
VPSLEYQNVRDVPRGTRRVVFRVVRWTLAAGVLVVLLVATFVAGLLLGTTRTYHLRGEHEAAQARNALAAMGPRFGRVTVDYSSTGHVYLGGTVADDEDLARLQYKMQALFGEQRGGDAVSGVRVDPQGRKD